MIPTFGSKSKLYEIIYNMCSWYDFCLKKSLQTTVKYYFTSIRMTIIIFFLMQNSKYWQNVEKLEHLLVGL